MSGVLEAWYGGSKGADAVANILFGDVNPSAKLPMTFPLSDADVPHPTIIKPAPGGTGNRPSQVTGEVKPAAHGVQVRVTLADGASGEKLRSATFDRDSSAMNTLESDAARSVAQISVSGLIL